MPDQLFDDLRTQVDFPLPEIAAVRRRGERRQRRNRLLAVGGVAAVVAAIVVPLVVAGSPRSEVAPVEPARAWETTIPADFPLSDGMGQQQPITVATYPYLPREDSPFIQGEGICQRMAWQAAGTVQLGGVRAGGDSGGFGETRILALYRDADTAHAAMETYRSAHDEATCGPQQTPLLDGTAGEETIVSLQGESGPTATLLTRVGNAVLLTMAVRSPGGTGSTGREFADQVEQRVDGVVEAMCVYAATGCDGTLASPAAVPSEPPAGQVVDPATFPLSAGMEASDPDAVTDALGLWSLGLGKERFWDGLYQLGDVPPATQLIQAASLTESAARVLAVYDGEGAANRVFEAVQAGVRAEAAQHPAKLAELAPTGAYTFSYAEIGWTTNVTQIGRMLLIDRHGLPMPPVDHQRHELELGTQALADQMAAAATKVVDAMVELAQ